MLERRLLYIINPISGNKKKGALEELIRNATAKAELPFEIFPSVASGDYSFLLPIIAEKEITDIVIAGGDGTVNQVISALKHTGLRFGILPCGSGNGLALSAGISRAPEKALNIIFGGKSQWTDTFLVNGRFACMLCGIGFDAQVAHDFANDPRRGLSTYVRKTVSNFFSAHPHQFTIRSGSRTIEIEAFFISLANSNQFGNNFTIAPQASLTDGMLDVVIVTRQNKLSLLYQTIRQVGGFNHLREIDVVDEKAAVLYFQTSGIEIHNPSLAPLHIDGEPAETAERLSIEVVKESFQLIYP
ncbi:MAG TPA: YegS/Rv2252/BmrU family lipid kinase [Flavisolibacter sp.]|jgi:YegS/Rv2252/BmrU family lipid kinase